MKNSRFGGAVILLSSLLIGGSIAGAAQEMKAEHVMLSPGDLKWIDGPPVLPGAKMVVMEGDLKAAGPFTMRIKFPADSKLAPHWHPLIEHVTILSGTFNLGTGEKFDPSKAMALPAGSFFVMPPKAPHFVVIKEETVIQVHGVGPWALNFVNPADDPRLKKQ